MSFELTDIEGPKSVQFGTVLCRWFTAMDFEGKPKTGPVIIKKKKIMSFYDEMEVPDKCISSEAVTTEQALYV